ncbi:ferric reduction oxidase 5-like isoform X2 [Trifolium pratense]|uniref:ferric reduction oxidase 5-like isoform X2 n=1 Tax=Trifolium pratense TaxID=57577 RepID=UPI001E69102E|nr:ferric reduction oxidase 5-like isoform X2 [Trifolium pratense]
MMKSHTIFLRIIFLLMFLGWLTVWILLPTKIYFNTLIPSLQNKLYSTYFREQGINLLLYTFPMMFIGALSCIYLHLHQEKITDKLHSRSAGAGALKRCLCFLRRPFLVMSPIGIVSSMELIFALMFAALLIWSLSNYIHNSFGHLHIHKQGEKIWEVKLKRVSLRFGYTGNICLAFLFFPVTRGSSILPLVGLTSESSIKYHIWLGHLSMLLFSAHAIGFIIYWAITNQLIKMVEWSKTYVSNVAGEIAILIALAMWITSIPRIRRKIWSNKLYQELSSTSLDHLHVSVEGPYGPHTAQFLRHEQIVMVSGGSGITPFISIIRDLTFQSHQQEFQAPKLLLVCIFKNYVDLTMLDLVLPISGLTTQISNLQLEIEAYITREKEEPSRDTQKHTQTIWFKPNLSDSPISAVLGPNNWLWLSAIITSSFIMFLLLLGILTHYYIYPIESKSGEVYNWTFKVMWYMFLLCACIFICSSVVFLWWKRHNTLENKQIMNEEVQTPTTSPGSWIYGSEREVESLPHQSLMQATQVHFGARPDLKKILFECEGKDVGVMVCGPRKLRHEVARICASGLADNLHFESISFNW